MNHRITIRIPDTAPELPVLIERILDALNRTRGEGEPKLSLNNFVLIAIRRELARRVRQLEKREAKHPERFPETDVVGLLFSGSQKNKK